MKNRRAVSILLATFFVATSWSICSAKHKPKWTKNQQQIINRSEKTMEVFFQRANKELAQYSRYDTKHCFDPAKLSNSQESKAQQEIRKVLRGIAMPKYLISDFRLSGEKGSVATAAKFNLYGKKGLKNGKLNKKIFGVDYRASFPRLRKPDLLISLCLPAENCSLLFVFNPQGKIKELNIELSEGE